MALPRVNETLNFSMKIPSTGERVKYRPYLVKEEKVLLQAFESGDLQTCLEAMVDTLESCIDERKKVNVASLATFDIEYMFTQVRSKSVGETSSILVKCTECEEQNPYEVDLESLEVEIGDKDVMIQVTEEIAVEMKYPTYESLLSGDVDKLRGEDTDTALQMIAGSIKTVYTEDEAIDCADQPIEEMVEFVSSMTATQLQSLSKFLEDMPTVRHEAKFVCEKCGAENNLELKGLADFF
jgi:hypothetical protein